MGWLTVAQRPISLSASGGVMSMRTDLAEQPGAESRMPP